MHKKFELFFFCVYGVFYRSDVRVGLSQGQRITELAA